MSAACKPICKPDVPEWDQTGETEQNERAVLVPVRRGHPIRERSSETRETYVALLITQRRLALSFAGSECIFTALGLALRWP